MDISTDILVERVVTQAAGEIHPLVRRYLAGQYGELPKLLAKINTLQEEPQLLDPHLQSCLPLLNDAFLTASKARRAEIATILYTFCKVRGEKVVSRFFNNEPKHIEFLLNITSASQQWEERYITLLWLAHLILTPFDLVTISIPGGHQAIAQIALTALVSASKERDAASKLLAALCLRPDMRAPGLLQAHLMLALNGLDHADDNVYRPIGYLTFLNSLISKADNMMIEPFLPQIVSRFRRILQQNSSQYETIRASAVSKKLLITLQRNLVVKLLALQDHSERIAKILDEGFLEETIDYLLSSADRDTPVRYAVAKAISVIAQSLDSNVASEIVDAVVVSLNEDPITANPLKWHTLTLALGHFLFRRIALPEQLPDVLKALSLALRFEQRSATGNPLGSNVRDAANFGWWSLARRYSTSELMAVDIRSLDAQSESNTSISVLQWTANQLVVTATLDPVGNIRRGSSAALQELIGRHPDTISHGISLVQVVDYQAVALRGRAMMEVGLNAAQLDQTYWNALIDGLFDWRGLRSPDRISRNFSARAIGLMSELKPFDVSLALIQKLKALLSALEGRDVETRHGLAMSVASIVRQNTTAARSVSPTPMNQLPIGELVQLCHLWDVFNGSVQFSHKDFSATSSRPELSAEAVVAIFSAICGCCLELAEVYSEKKGVHAKMPVPGNEALATFNLCLSTTDSDVLASIPQTCVGLAKLLPEPICFEIVKSWLNELKALRNAPRAQGLMVALAATWTVWHNQPSDVMTQVFNAILEEILGRTINYNVEIRIIAVRCLGIFAAATNNENASLVIREKIYFTLHGALNDYEITERGDVGSLVRQEALKVIGDMWTSQVSDDSEESTLCIMSVHRLALERLDKIRLQAARCLMIRGVIHSQVIDNLTDVSTFDYFYEIAGLLYRFPRPELDLITSILEGFSSSAGAGSDAISEVARSALACVLNCIPTRAPDSQSLSSFAEVLTSSLSRSLETERTLVPLLSLAAFLLDAGILQRLTPIEFNWRRLLAHVQKSHFKSTNMAKLLIVVQIYRGLAEVDVLRAAVVAKLFGMLLHPFPKIRFAVAEVLFVVLEDDSLKPLDLSQPPRALKTTVDDMRTRLAVA